MLPLVVLLALATTVGTGAGPLGPGPGPSAIGAVPPEPEAIVLDEPVTLQAVVADLDGAGAPVVVRLLQGRDGAVLVEAWRHAEAWRPSREPLEVVPPGGTRFDVAFDASPARLVVRRTGERQRVTLVRQPRFDPPGLEPECCLQLHDVHLGEDGRLQLVTVGSAPAAVDAVLALDLDGDGTDELLASRSLRPLGRTAYPSEMLVYRWRGERFAAPVLTELPIGSGDTPFVLGETDGQPGEEAGIIGTAAQSRLSRIVLDEGDRVRSENAGTVAVAAVAVELHDGPGVAVIGPMAGLSVHRWPPGEPLGPALATQPLRGGRFIGVATGAEESIVVVERAPGATAEVYAMPDLAFARGPGASAAAEQLGAGMPRPYRGPFPGGGVLADGMLLDADHESGGTAVAVLADAIPIGLAGTDRRWMVIGHGMDAERTDPRGGRLVPVGTPVAGTLALVPAASVLTPEADGGALDPPTADAFVLDAAGTLGVTASGFDVRIDAPPGTRAVHAGTVIARAAEAGEPPNGTVELRLPPPAGEEVATVVVVTPAGATYVARWDVVPLTDPPPLTAASRTPLGSTAVEVTGESVPYARVSVDGRDVALDERGRFSAEVAAPPWPTEVELVAVDPAGNARRATLSVIGLIDYRALPWIPISLALLGAVAGVLYVRAPRSSPRAHASDDAALEDLDPGSGV